LLSMSGRKLSFDLTHTFDAPPRAAREQLGMTPSSPASSSGRWASASSLPGLQRVATVAFVIAFLSWLGALPTPWFEREANGVVSFNYHPLCMTFAFVVLMPEAVIAYADGEERRGMSHAAAKRTHAVLNVIATTSLIMGLMAIFANHAGHEIPPLYSAHSWMGVITASLVCGQAALGVSVYLFTPAGAVLRAIGVVSSAGSPGGVASVSEARKTLAPYHRVLGYASFASGAATCLSGLSEKQAFLKCPIDPTYKYCYALALPNVLVALGAVVTSCAFGTIRARLGSRSRPAAATARGEDVDWSEVSEEDTREDARAALVAARRRTRTFEEEDVNDLES